MAFCVVTTNGDGVRRPSISPAQANRRRQPSHLWSGTGLLRIKVAGNTSREFTAAELDTMCALLEERLTQGAAGFSSGLMYAPGLRRTAEELTALARVAARKGAVYATHMRSYSAGLVQAVEEQIAIARASGCALQISHLQAAGDEYWPLQQRAIDAIEEASAEGVDVSFDAYPWLAGSTVMTQILPQSALRGRNRATCCGASQIPCDAR